MVLPNGALDTLGPPPWCAGLTGAAEAAVAPNAPAVAATAVTADSAPIRARRPNNRRCTDWRGTDWRCTGWRCREVSDKEGSLRWGPRGDRTYGFPPVFLALWALTH